MSDQSGLHIHVTGTVQGVGFRPFVYNLATSLGLNGWVLNSSSGVDIELSGPAPMLDKFLKTLRDQPPYLARIDSIITQKISPSSFSEFTIRESRSQPGEFIAISPDVSICPDCRRELFSPEDRRFRYPFINCTNCGPRFTIIKDIPYDRPNTTMAEFDFCPDCNSEYHDPSDRRFHAQPVACPVCGPEIKYISPAYESRREKALQDARQALTDGKILAIKGLGGYHLACDAANPVSVENLRKRKKRSEKPFALMAFDTQTISKFVHITSSEEKLLNSPQHPIVLLHKNPSVSSLNHTSPNQNHLGFMLPYTPLHLLLLEPATGFPEVLVMTSGNISEEPIAYNDEDAFIRLEDVADGFLTHDRPIHTRVDDSVLRVFEDDLYPLRRSRGYTPEPVVFSSLLPEILACGAELKNTFAFSREKYLFISHHIGDLENFEAFNAFETGIDHFKRIFRLTPQTIAVDLHPDYLSTKYGVSEAENKKLSLINVQHHHAHLAACLADNQYISDYPVTGLIFDGTGYGDDGTIWGGEILVGGYRSYERRFHLEMTPLPGGDSAIRNPAKIALAHLFAKNIEWTSDLPSMLALCSEEQTVLKAQLIHHINTPLTSSMGRLFDAVSALIGIRQKNTYEAQAAIELENICDPDETGFYEVGFKANEISILDIYPQLLLDYYNGTPTGIISARFHNTISRICSIVCKTIRHESGINNVALSGGVWQNMTLLKKTLLELRKEGFTPLIHHKIPANDGGISAGQLLVAASILQK